MTPRALVIDDHELLGHSLVVALQGRGLSASRVAVDDFDTVVREVYAAAPDVVLLDLQLGKPIGSGLRLVGPCRAAGAKVLVVTGANDRLAIAECLEAGASGFLSKAEPFDALITATLRLAAGQDVLALDERTALLAELGAHRTRASQAAQVWGALTTKEREVLGRLVSGVTVQNIADDAHVAITTVRAQVRAIHRKLGVASQLEAVAMAVRSGWYRN